MRGMAYLDSPLRLTILKLLKGFVSPSRPVPGGAPSFTVVQFFMHILPTILSLYHIYSNMR